MRRANSNAPPRRLDHVPLAFPASKTIGLVCLHDPPQRLGILPRGVQEPAPPSEGVRRHDVAAPRGFPHRLALRQRFPERQPALLLVQPLKRCPSHCVEGPPAGFAKIAPQAARLALAHRAATAAIDLSSSASVESARAATARCATVSRSAVDSQS